MIQSMLPQGGGNLGAAMQLWKMFSGGNPSASTGLPGANPQAPGSGTTGNSPTTVVPNATPTISGNPGKTGTVSGGSSGNAGAAASGLASALGGSGAGAGAAGAAGEGGASGLLSSIASF